MNLSALKNVFLHPSNQGSLFLTLCRVLWWKFNQIFFDFPVIYQLTKSIKIICEPSSSYGSFIVYARFPEHEEMEFIHSYLQPKDVMIDVGANIGAISLLAADKITHGKIFAFEPTPSVANKLKLNVRLNGLENIIACFVQAVSNKNGFLHFKIEGQSEVNHIVNSSTKGDSKDIIKVSSTTLDTFVKNNNLKQVDLLKIDVEGAEQSVFDGAKTSLSKHVISVIVFEANPKMKKYGTSSKKLISFIQQYGYSVFAFSKDKLLPLKDVSDFKGTVNLVAVAPTPSIKKRLSKLLG